MRIKRTVLFILILGAVASTYFYFVYQPRATQAKLKFSPEATQEKILTLERDEHIVRLHLKNNMTFQGEIAFQRDDNRRWHIAEPVEDRAEGLIVSGMTGLLKTMERQRSLSMEGVSGSDFGFDAPRFIACVTTTRVENERCLHFGNDTNIPGYLYAKWLHEDGYFTMKRSFLSAFDKSLYTLRKKQIFHMRKSAIHYLRIIDNGLNVEIRKEEKGWRITKPRSKDLSTEEIDQFLKAINGVYIKEFMDDRRDNSDGLGFDKPTRVIRVIYDNGTKQTLSQGIEAPARFSYYAKTDVSPSPVLVSKPKLDDISANLDQLLA